MKAQAALDSEARFSYLHYDLGPCRVLSPAGGAGNKDRAPFFPILVLNKECGKTVGRAEVSFRRGR